jgi:cytochrome P450
VSQGLHNTQKLDLIFSNSVGFSQSFGFLPYGDTWRKQRRMASQNLSPSMATKYHALQEKETATLIQNLLKDPKTLRQELQ